MNSKIPRHARSWKRSFEKIWKDKRTRESKIFIKKKTVTSWPRPLNIVKIQNEIMDQIMSGFTYWVIPYPKNVFVDAKPCEVVFMDFVRIFRVDDTNFHRRSSTDFKSRSINPHQRKR